MCPFVRKGTFLFDWRYFITSLPSRQFVQIRNESSSRDIRIIQWTLHSQTTSLQHMSIDHRGLYILVSKQFLNRTNVITILKQVSSKRVAERVRGYAFIYLRKLSRIPDRPLQCRFMDVMAARYSCFWIRREGRCRKDVL